MSLLVEVWVVIDAVFVMLFFQRKREAESGNKTRQRTLEKMENLMERMLNAFPQAVSLFLVSVFVYLYISQIPNSTMLNIEENGYNFTLGLLPEVVSWIRERKISIKSIGERILFISMLFLSIVVCVADITEIESSQLYRNVLNVLITVFMVSFSISLIKMITGGREFYSKTLSKKGIRKDLYYRTPRLKVDVSRTELILFCEKFFSEYMRKYEKIGDLHTIEYVSLLDESCIKIWYKKAGHIMKMFIGISTFAVIISMRFGLTTKQLEVMGLILFFGIIIKYYEKTDEFFLHKIGIRYAYDEWGYYLEWENKNKFVGTVQLVELSKAHRYVHSILDIAALCRAVAFNDKLNGDNKICIITRNLGELFINYSDYEQKKNWIMIIPLWIAALFEFSVTGEIEAETKIILLESADERVKADVNIFLQSFWVDMERKELKCGVLEYMQSFKKELRI